MKANELRLGNLVGIASSLNFSIGKVTLISNNRILLDNKISNKNHKFIPVKLTEEWLLRFGFDKAVNGWWSSDEIFSYRDGYFGFGVDRHTKIQYVHELQNLYFALTGEELTI